MPPYWHQVYPLNAFDTTVPDSQLKHLLDFVDLADVRRKYGFHFNLQPSNLHFIYNPNKRVLFVGHGMGFGWLAC